MEGLATIIEEGIRYPGFAFINVQSPCVTYGEPEFQIKVQKAIMQSLEKLGHDSTDRLRAMALAQEYGHKLYTGVFYRSPDPTPTFEAAARERHKALAGTSLPKEKILEMFLPH
jgi:2-oxoglutarate ferredoxin oxidoreductase subunit beta